MYDNASKIALKLMLGVENVVDENGLPYVVTALFCCLCVPGGVLEPFRRVILSGGFLHLKRQRARKYNSPKWL